MPLNAATRVGPYQIVSQLGAGGMGEVYRATDARLNRDVALKVLPEAFAADRERMARFEREAQLLASLNHPHIAAIYGVEEAEGHRCLVLELVEGDTLDDRLSRGALPVSDALDVARQVAEALEAAHEKGIIHRDLKPSNIKVTPDGIVKVLDFGLAKGLVSDAASDPALSPTISIHATEAGVLLGTAAYMSPEQARGRPLDKRTDVWSFGCLLFELLTGQRPFAQSTITDTLAAIVRGDPDWSLLPADTPPRIRALIKRCLQKDRKTRLRDMGDALLEIDDAIAQPHEAMAAAATAPAARGTRAPWVLASALTIVVAALAWALWSRGGGDAPVARFTIDLPGGIAVAFDDRPVAAISPDGTRLVFTARAGMKSQLYERRLDQFDGRFIPGSEGATAPHYSPDGRWILFESARKLRRAPADGGQPEVLADSREWFGGTWTGDNRLIFTPSYPMGLWQIPASGGTAQKLTAPDAARKELGHWWPQALPNGKAVLFTAFSTPLERSRVAVYSLDTGKHTPVIERATFGRYVATGHVLFMRGTSLMAVRFDSDRLTTTGDPAVVVDDVANVPSNGVGLFTVSGNGTLAYLRSSQTRTPKRLVWIDRSGKRTPVIERLDGYETPRLSPDGRRLALTIIGDSSDVWVLDLERGTSTKITHGAASDFKPTWTPDGRRLFFTSEQPVFDVHVKAADGSGPEEPVLESEYDKHITSVSPNGRTLAMTEANPATSSDLWMVPWSGSPGKPVLFRRTPFSEEIAVFSPDSRWVAYQANESGRFEVYVEPYPGPGSRTQVSVNGGTGPVWAKNGRELFYRSGHALMAVPVTLTPEFTAGRPVQLFEADFLTPYMHPGYDVMADGRFIVVQNDESAPPPLLHVVLNWFSELNRKAK